MAEYRVIYWKHIPTMVLARDGDQQARCALPPRFQAAVDAQAMAEGNTSDQTYSAAFHKSAWQSRSGEPEAVAQAVAAELEAALDTKDKMAVAALAYLWEQFRSRRGLWLEPAATPADRLRAWLAYQASLVQKERATLAVYYDYWLESAKREAVGDKLNQMYNAWRADVRELLQSAAGSEAPGGIDLDVLAAAAIALVQGAALQTILNSQAFDQAAYFEAVERLLTGVLGTGRDG